MNAYQWCNGEVYGYEVERVTTCKQCDGEDATFVDSGWENYGLDPCLSEAQAAVTTSREPDRTCNARRFGLTVNMERLFHDGHNPG